MSNLNIKIIETIKDENDNSVVHECGFPFESVQLMYRYQLKSKDVLYLYEDGLRGFYQISTEDPLTRNVLQDFIEEIQPLYADEDIALIQIFQDDELLIEIPNDKLIRIECQNEFITDSERLNIKLLERM